MIAVLVVAVAGWGYCRCLDREAGPLESALVGAVVAAMALLALDLLSIRWSALSFLVALAVISAPWFFRVAAAAPAAGRPKRAPLHVIAVHACTAAVVAWHVAYALRPDLWDWTGWLISRRDFFFIWGYKARLFFTMGGIPWSFLRSLPRDFTHPDYPLLVPLIFDIDAVLTGAWRPATLAAIDTALAVGLLAVVYRTLRDDFDALYAAAATLALSGCALLPWVGFAEGPLVAYGGTAALLVRRALRGRAGSMPLAVFALAAAAMTKNEGMALAAAIGIALAMERRDLLMKMWPVAVVIAAWLAARAALDLPTDLFTGAVAARVAHNLRAFPGAFATVPTYQPIVWIVSLLAAVPYLRRERFLLTVAAIQLLFYLAAYAITPLDVVGHVNGSWPRLTSHVTIFIAFAGATSIGTMLER
jgi:hypothetical protein